MNSRTILFCGGGSLGHLLPSLAVFEQIQNLDPSIRGFFLHAKKENEAQLLTAKNIPSAAIISAKCPRGVSLRFFAFPFLFLASFVQSARIIQTVRPSALFSKGGYVSVPPCIVGWLLGIPIILHTSDATPSLSDRFIGRFARCICTGFPLSFSTPSLRTRAVYTGNPVRQVIFSGSRERGLAHVGFSGKRPILLVMGGSQGARAINDAVARSLKDLLRVADVIHLTGAGKGSPQSHPAYFSAESAGEELADLYAVADVVVTRAGAGSLSELAALGKAAVVLPLQGVAHDHQLRNAEYMSSKHAAHVLLENQYDSLAEILQHLVEHPDERRSMGKSIEQIFPHNAAKTIATVILDVLHS